MSPPISATCDGDGPAAGGMTAFKSLDDIEVAGKRVLVRVDLNVPMREGAVGDATRIDRVAPTLSELAERGARVIVASHFGRPKGKPVAAMSLSPLAEPLSHALGGLPVQFVSDCIGEQAEAAVAALAPGDVALLENLRFHPGEEANDPAFADALARARRFLRQRCILRCASRPCLHDRRGGASAERGGAPHAGRAGGARQGVAGARAAGRRRRRRRQSLDQARGPRQPDPPGRPPRHRRRHGQHLPPRARGRRGRIAPRARPGGGCAPHHGERRREPGAPSCCPPMWR